MLDERVPHRKVDAFFLAADVCSGGIAERGLLFVRLPLRKYPFRTIFCGD